MEEYIVTRGQPAWWESSVGGLEWETTAIRTNTKFRMGDSSRYGANGPEEHFFVLNGWVCDVHVIIQSHALRMQV